MRRGIHISTLKYTESPEQTPPIKLSFSLRYNRLVILDLIDREGIMIHKSMYTQNNTPKGKNQI
jgi:hypothetical protein